MYLPKRPFDPVRYRCWQWYYDYTTVDNIFQMVIPGNSKALLAGLEGSPDKVRAAPKTGS